jgi:hypothetical protein
MTSSNTRTFVHRRNSNRTVDSICTQCVATVARREKEEDLAGAEAAHVCDAHLVEDRQRWVRAWMGGHEVPSDAPGS